MPDQTVTCSACGAQTPLAIEGFVAARMFCPRCAEPMRALVRAIGRCPHGRRGVVWPDSGEVCPECAAGVELDAAPAYRRRR